MLIVVGLIPSRVALARSSKSAASSSREPSCMGSLMGTSSSGVPAAPNVGKRANGICGVSGRLGSLCLDVGDLDHLRPFRDICFSSGKLAWRTDDRLEAERGQLFRDIRLGHALSDLVMEPLESSPVTSPFEQASRAPSPPLMIATPPLRCCLI